MRPSRSLARFGGLFLWAIRSLPSLARSLPWICARGPLGRARRRLALDRSARALSQLTGPLQSAFFRNGAFAVFCLFSSLGLVACALALILASKPNGQIALAPLGSPLVARIAERPREFHLLWARRDSSSLAGAFAPPVSSPAELPEAAAAARRLGLSFAPISAGSAIEPREALSRARESAPPGAPFFFSPEPLFAGPGPSRLSALPLNEASEPVLMAHALASSRVAHWSPWSASLAFLNPQSPLFLSAAAAESSVAPRGLSSEELPAARLGARLLFEALPARALSLFFTLSLLPAALLLAFLSFMTLVALKDLAALLAAPLDPRERSALESGSLQSSLPPPAPSHEAPSRPRL